MGMPFVKPDMGRARRPEAAGDAGRGFGEELMSRPHVLMGPLLSQEIG